MKKEIVMKGIVVCFLLFALPGISYSEDKSKRESVEKLLILMNVESIIDTMYSQMEQLMVGMGQQLGVKPSEQEIFDKFMSKTVSIMKKEMSWAKMKEPMMQIYLKHYSEKEIQDMVVFYNSESGKSMIQKMPEVMKDSMLLSQKMVKDFIPKMQEMSEELKEELAAARKAQK